MIAIVDYGAGNLTSVCKAVRHLGFDCIVTSADEQIRDADKLIIPGVGNFKATLPLSNGHLGLALQDCVDLKKPVLGICLGLQWMFAGSEEAPGISGLNAFQGTCSRFTGQVKVPHVGWNQIEIGPSSRLLQGIESGSYVYYTHSYRAPLCAATVGVCNYGSQFTAAVENDHLYGVQFHPEKSGEVGCKILENFCAL